MAGWKRTKKPVNFQREYEFPTKLHFLRILERYLVVDMRMASVRAMQCKSVSTEEVAVLWMLKQFSYS